MSKDLFFTVKSGLKDIIGKDLITDDNIAIFELVKNSYDAHAKNVIITFEKNSITIADDGKGMSEEDLSTKWLAVAYSAKKDGTEDSEEDVETLPVEKRESYRDKIQAKRFYAGAKGIGRFSCDRLGDNLILLTRKIGTSTLNKLNVNWSSFNKNSKEDFIRIPIPYTQESLDTVEFPNSSEHGTVLVIQNSSNWGRIKIKELKHSLEKLINPFSETNEFTLEIICKSELKEDNALKKDNTPKYIDRDKINGIVKNSILDILKLKTTQIEVIINELNIETRLFDRGSLIYHISEKNKYNPFISNLKLDLYYLNRAAKINFNNKMGIPPVQYGSVFLFKNGFRVQPYGDIGDDSWGLDFRAQQGYSRYLSTRDLFGRVDITTLSLEEAEQFKEVSSRDGGLVATAGLKQMMDVFKENGLKRLERYVVGVLWGEAFKKNNYFKSQQEAQKFRDILLEKDKDSDDFSVAKSNIGSKIDFIRLIKSLVDDKNISVLDFNRELVDIVNDNLDSVQPKFIKDLEKIAELTGDENLRKNINATEEAFDKLERAKEEALRKAKEEEERRKRAEQKAKEAEELRQKEEQKAKKERERRQKAELEAERKEKDRALAELAKIKAEQKAREAEELRQKEEQKAKEADEQRKQAENLAKKREQQLKRSRSSETIEYKDLRDSNHIIGVYSDDISKKILLIKRKIDKNQEISNKELLEFIKGISFANEKISTLTRFTTKSNFLEASLESTEDIVNYIRTYVEDIYKTLYNDNDIEFIDNGISLIKTFEPIELSMAIDNILSNSRKKKASKIILEFFKSSENISLSIRDVGMQLDKSIPNPDLIFEEGITTTKGSGLGLNHVKRIVENNLKGRIHYNPEYKDGFELIITF